MTSNTLRIELRSKSHDRLNGAAKAVGSPSDARPAPARPAGDACVESVGKVTAPLLDWPVLRREAVAEGETGHSRIVPVGFSYTLVGRRSSRRGERCGLLS